METKSKGKRRIHVETETKKGAKAPQRLWSTKVQRNSGGRREPPKKLSPMSRKICGHPRCREMTVDRGTASKSDPSAPQKLWPAKVQRMGRGQM